MVNDLMGCETDYPAGVPGILEVFDVVVVPGVVVPGNSTAWFLDFPVDSDNVFVPILVFEIETLDSDFEENVFDIRGWVRVEEKAHDAFHSNLFFVFPILVPRLNPNEEADQRARIEKYAAAADNTG